MKDNTMNNNQDTIFKSEFNIPLTLQKLNQLLIQNGYDNEVQYHLDKFYYLIHKLNQAQLDDKSLGSDEFVRLHSEILENLFGKSYYKKVLTILEHLAVIEQDSSYQVGMKSKGYRLTEAYRTQPSTYIERTSSAGSFIEKLHKFYKNKTERFFYKNEYRAAYLILKTVVFDEERTIRTLKKKFSEWSLDEDMLPTTLCPLSLEEVKNRLLEMKQESAHAIKMAYWLSSIIRILKKEWQFSVDEKGFRLHSNITNLPKELRQCILLDGTNDLVEIDIPASQLLFLAVKLKSILGIEYKVHGDFKRFLMTTVNKDIYSSIGEHLKLFPEYASKEERGVIRNEVKGKLFEKILFGKTYPNEYTDCFYQQYPTILNYVKSLKEKDYRHCSVVLQKEESSFIFGTCIKNLLTVNANIFFLTVHDSIICKRSDLAMVYDTMTRLFFKRYGENITPKVSYFIKDHKPKATDKFELSWAEESMLREKRRQKEKQIADEKQRLAKEMNELYEGIMEMGEIDKEETWKKDLQELDDYLAKKKQNVSVE